MIYTDIDIKDYVYSWLKNSTLAGMVSGGVHKDPRPLNSEKEDICISVIARDAGQTQTATVNVNIYVPDIPRGNEMIEDIPRLRTLSTEAATLLEYKNSGGIIAALSSQEVMKVQGIDFHCINNRLRLKFNNE